MDVRSNPPPPPWKKARFAPDCVTRMKYPVVERLHVVFRKDQSYDPHSFYYILMIYQAQLTIFSLDFLLTTQIFSILSPNVKKKLI